MKNRKPTCVAFHSLESRNLFAADLQITAINMTPKVIAAGNSFEFEMIIKNAGNTAAVDVQVLPKLSVDNLYGNADDLSLGYKTYHGTIAPGASVSVPVKQYSASYYASGDYRIVAKVDPFSKVVEDSDANNTSTTASAVLTIAKKLTVDSISGTSGKDVITIREQEAQLVINVNGEVFSRTIGAVSDKFFVDAGAGNDKVLADSTVTKILAVTGGGGNDTLIGGSANDEISGANGKDKVYGGAGHDYCLGGAGADRVEGEVGNDICSGGGGNDTLVAGVGFDYLLGGAGNDSLFADDTTRDTLSGNAGNDTAITDATDQLAGIEVK